MNLTQKTTLLCFFIAASASGGLTVTGVATSSTPVTASGTLDGIGWTATTTASSPFVGINLPSGTWNLGTPLPTDALFLAAESVNAGDTQTFVFDQPVNDIYFYVENFDSSSAANIVSDGSLYLVSATADISFAPTSPNSASVSTANTSFDGVGDMVLLLSGPTTFVQFDYTGGNQNNGVFYGFAVEQVSTGGINTTAVPEPSSFLLLLASGCLGTCVRRHKMLQALNT